MSSIFELQARVRRLRDALAYLKDATSRDAGELREALLNRDDGEVREEWTRFVAELRAYGAMAETLTPKRATRKRSARGRPRAEGVGATPTSWSFEPGATLH